VCKTVISRGGATAKNYTMSALNNHLLYKHPDEHKSFAADKKASLAAKSDKSVPTTGPAQPTLAEFAAKKRKWAIDSPEAGKIHQAI